MNIQLNTGFTSCLCLRGRPFALLLLLGLMLVPAERAQATDLYWTGATTNLRYNEGTSAGNWETYNPNTDTFSHTTAIPTSADNVYFGYLGGSNTVNFNANAAAYDTNIVAGTFAFNLAGHTDTTQNALVVGDYASATLNASGGTISATFADFGQGDGTTAYLGVLNLTNTTLNTGGGNSTLGYDKGVGTVNIGTGSTWTGSGGDIYVGLSGTGTLNLTTSSSQFSTTGNLFVGTIGSGLSLNGTGTVSVTGGGQATVRYLNAGDNAGDQGTVSVSGSGSHLTSSSYLILGYDGTGTATVSSSGTISVLNGYGVELAEEGTAKGTLNLNSNGVLETGSVIEGVGTGTINFNGGILRATADSSDFISNFSAGAVTLASGGGTIDSNGHAITVSTILGGVGALTKSGAGSLTLSGTSTFTGGVNLNGGTLQVNAAENAGTSGALGKSGTITFNGGTLQYSSVNAFDYSSRFSTAANQAYRIDTNGRNVSFGTALTSSNGTFFKTGTGTLTFSGATANTYSGITTISGGELDLHKSDSTNAIAGDVTVNGGTLKWQGHHQVADSSHILLSSGAVDLNGYVETVQAFTNSGGTFSTGAGSMTLAGTGGSFTWSGGTNTINTGGFVEGSNFIITGGTNTVQGGSLPGVISVDSGGTGLELTGANITLNSDNAGPGILSLNSNVITSHASATASTISTTSSGSRPGQIYLSGASSINVEDGAAASDLTISASIVSGTLIKNGAGTLTLSGTNTYTGGTTIDFGTLAVQGLNGSISHASADLIAGSYLAGAGGTLLISTGGKVTDRNAYIGYDGDGVGTATVTGLNGSVASTWNNSGTLSVGYNGTGTLRVEDGGQVTNTDGYIGYASTAGGTATVTGVHGSTASSWINSGTLTVGYDGAGILTIADGGQVTNTDGYIGYDLGASGTVTVTGVNANGTASTWTNSGQLTVGYAATSETGGTGVLNIQDGGRVINTTGYVGDGNSTAQVTVSGVNVNGTASTWTNNGNLFVGMVGTGTLHIENGGQVTDQSGEIGFNSSYDTNGTVTVTGVNSNGTASTWSNSSGLDVGIAGTGTLNIQDGGVVKVGGGTGVVTLAELAGSVGTLNIGNGSGAGTLLSGQVTGGAGTARVVFGQTDASYTFAPNLTGSLSVTQSGTGTTHLTGANTYTGGTTVTAGKLAVDGSISGNVSVQSGSEFGGHGTVGGTIGGAGSVGPGNSPGILTAGATDPTGGLTYNFEFTQAGVATWSNAAASGNDVLHLTLATPFTAPLTSANNINVYFSQLNLTYQGGFFINGATDNLSSNIANATFNYFLLDNTSGTIIYNGNKYDQITGQVIASTLQITGANFSDGTVNGWTDQFAVGTAVVPEPSTYALLGIGMLVLMVMGRRRGLRSVSI